MKKRVAIVLGTRPEIIKMSPIIHACQKRGIDFFILHTGQHYSPNMDKDFFDELALPAPKYNLGIGDQPHRKQVGLMVREMTRVFKTEKPDIIIVEGDTISVLAGSLAAKNLGIKIAHHEAGLRSHDPSMIEETNRVTTDHISDFLFAPTLEAVKNLTEEGYSPEQVFLTGNTIVDAIKDYREIAESKSKILEKFGLKLKEYFLFTAHRSETVDKKETCLLLVDCLNKLSDEFPDYRVVYPVHPRTIKMLEKFNLDIPQKILITEPLPFLDFVRLESNSRLVITDSGGLQEEACILKVPCITIRNNTERPETVERGMNILVGLDAHKLTAAVREMLNKKIEWKELFGEYGVGDRIVSILQSSWSS
ncbi:MAG: UDP-N-acetylglucosamine 2-epimerase (non-hydrolyzing) [bacterium]|nr:UDP-N-acetylglucosamine 2-epimerase (non-hydrolyzing) [bacterium]